MNPLIRTFHRWTSIVFVAAVVAYMVAMSGGTQPPVWMGLAALVPLILLAATGLYMFAAHYLARLRRRGGAA